MFRAGFKLPIPTSGWPKIMTAEIRKLHRAPVGTSHDIMQRQEMNGNPNSDVMCVCVYFVVLGDLSIYLLGH